MNLALPSSRYEETAADRPLPALCPSNDSLRRAFAFESEESLTLLRQMGIQVPEERKNRE